MPVTLALESRDMQVLEVEEEKGEEEEREEEEEKEDIEL